MRKNLCKTVKTVQLRFVALVVASATCSSLLPLNVGIAEDANQVSSWEKPTSTAAAPAASTPAATTTTIATGDFSVGGTIDITELKRTSGDTVTLKFVVNNTGSEELDLGAFGGDWYSWNLTKVYLLDLQNKKKYFILTDSEKQPLSSRGGKKLQAGAKLALWAKFPAPPATVTKVTVEIPNTAPFEDLPISN